MGQIVSFDILGAGLVWEQAIEPGKEHGWQGLVWVQVLGSFQVLEIFVLLKYDESIGYFLL